MNASINCHVSLSKKLRALIGKEGSITLIVQRFKEGKGDGFLSITGENIDFDKNISGGETSIQLEMIGKMKMEVGAEDQACTNIFSSTPPKGHEEKVVNKIAVVNAPEKTEVSTSIKTREQINYDASIAKAIPSLSCKKWIQDMEQLMSVVNKAKTKRSDIDVDSAQTDREKIILMQMKEKEEAIDMPAWIVNENIGNLSVNDLGIDLPLNIPYDLSSVSARRLAASKDLRILIRDKHVRFISPQEKDIIINKATSKVEGMESIPVFDNHREAIEAIEKEDKQNPIIGEDSVEVTASDINNFTEDESAILNLTQSMPLTKDPRTVEKNTEPKRTVHGLDSSASLKSPPKPSFKRAF